MSRWWWCALLAGCTGVGVSVGDSGIGIDVDDGGLASTRCEARVWDLGPTQPIDPTGTMWTVSEPGTPLDVGLSIDLGGNGLLEPAEVRIAADGRVLTLWEREAHAPLPTGAHELVAAWTDDTNGQVCFPPAVTPVDVRVPPTPPDTLADGVWMLDGTGQHPDAALFSRVLDATRAEGRALTAHVQGGHVTLAVHTRTPGFPTDGCVTAGALDPATGALDAWDIPDDSGGVLHVRDVVATLLPRTSQRAALSVEAVLDLRDTTLRTPLCGDEGPIARAGLACGACPDDDTATACAAVSFAAVDATLRPATEVAACPD